MAAKLDDPSKVWTLEDSLKRGEKVYATHCVACHQANGKGAGAIKAVDGSAVVLHADKGKQIAVLLNGQNNAAMPSWKPTPRTTGPTRRVNWFSQLKSPLLATERLYPD